MHLFPSPSSFNYFCLAPNLTVKYLYPMRPLAPQQLRAVGVDALVGAVPPPHYTLGGGATGTMGMMGMMGMMAVARGSVEGRGIDTPASITARSIDFDTDPVDQRCC